MRAKNTVKERGRNKVLLIGLFCLVTTFAPAQENTEYALHDLKKWVGHRQATGSTFIGYYASLRPAGLPPDGPSPPSSLRRHFSVSEIDLLQRVNENRRKIGVFTPFWPPVATSLMPFFCRIEHNLGLKTQVPIKFRLGSVEYVDWLERKGRHFVSGNY